MQPTLTSSPGYRVCPSYSVSLKPIAGLFSQSYKLERPDSDAKVRFFHGVVDHGLEGRT